MTKAWKRTSRRLHQIHIWWFLFIVISIWVCGLKSPHIRWITDQHKIAGLFYILAMLKLNVDFTCFEISGEFPFKLGNTHISLKISGGIPLIVSKSLKFALFKAVNRNISAYICFLRCFFIQ
jgi:hypothetical protein